MEGEIAYKKLKKLLLTVEFAKDNLRPRK